MQKELGDSGISATLVVPLYGRAEITRRFPGFLKDDEAVRLVETLPYDFSAVREEYKGEYWLAASAARAYRFDRAVKEYAGKHPKTVVVNIGAGLDTTFLRVDNGGITWYDLDLPDVIKIRKSVIKETERSHCIAASAFDTAWFDQIPFKKEDGILFLAGGFFYYFKPEDNARLAAELAKRFPGGELLFDACSKAGVKIANKKVADSGNKDAEMFFYVNDKKELYAWSENIAEVEIMPLYSAAARKGAKWNALTKINMFFGDLFKMTRLARIRFKD
ncbi:MAG: class I SAM-dependent methyltransferase [Clostridiales bacterium]|jgi:O-methyltransferase involved in polyketide biosynthesis|nr:class I SAM-dependent methyltransferase [Clostridiales bacterium]